MDYKQLIEKKLGSAESSNYIIHATVDGKTKTFRVRGAASEAEAKKKFEQHHATTPIVKVVKEEVELEEAEAIEELSSEKLGEYKKKASADATAADAKGDFKRGDKRYSGIIKATKKQFANDMKKYTKEEAMQVTEQKHRVLVTVSDPNHTAVTKRKEQIQKFVRLTADNERHAVEKAKAHYKKQGYKIHDALHVGMVNEADLEETHLPKGTKIKDGKEELTVEKPIGKDKYLVKAKEPKKVEEAMKHPFDWKGYIEQRKKQKSTSGETKTGHIIKKTETGTVYIKKANADGNYASHDEKKASGEEPVKRGRGRPPGKYGSYKERSAETNARAAAKMAATKAARKAAMKESFDEEFVASLFEDFTDEQDFLDFEDLLQCEEFEQLDELSKDTLASYYSKAIGDRHSKDLARDSAKRKGDKDTAKKLGDKIYNRSVGLEKAKTKFFAKEDVDLEESEKFLEEEIEIDEAAKWRSTSVAQKITSPDSEDSVSYDYHKEVPRSTGMLRSKYDTSGRYGSLENRPKAEVATSGKRKGMVTKQHIERLKARIKARNEEVDLDEAEILDEMQHGKEYSHDHVMKKVKSGDWEAVTDIKPGKLVELRHHSGKKVTVKVKNQPIKEETTVDQEETLDESINMYANFLARK